MKILIVDDDMMIRKWLTMLLQQIPDHQITVLTAKNADEAELRCNQEKIDLVITDITMPQRDGLDLLRVLMEQHPEISTACLSAYDDYTYVRKALKLGTLDYIRKSEMVIEDIISLLEKVESRSYMERSEHLSRKEKERLAAQNQLMGEVMDGSEEARERLYEQFGCEREKGLVVLSFQLEHVAGSEQDEFRTQLLCQKTIQNELKKGIAVAVKPDCIVALFAPSSNTVEGREAESMKISLLFKRNLGAYAHQKVLLTICEICHDPKELQQTVERALDVTEARQYYPDFPAGREAKRLTAEDVNHLRQLLKWESSQNNQRTLIELFRKQIDQWHQELMLPRDLKGAVIFGLTILLPQTDAAEENLTYLINYNKTSRRIRNARDWKELLSAFEKFSADYLSNCAPAARGSNPSMQAAIRYINECYMQKITLDDVAKQVFLNRTYVSQLFKKHLNVSFVDYLESVRISHAKDLLVNTQLSVSQVSERVGYANQSYFTKVFKRNTGFSPQSYRQLAVYNKTPKDPKT